MDTGTKVYRNYFPITFGTQCDIQYGKAYPVFRKLMYPGDVFKVHADLLIRYQPMLSPPMNGATATVRFAFVPLRLIEENTELIVTGSNDGHLSSETIPVMDSCFKYLYLGVENGVMKHSILDYLYQIPLLTGLTDAMVAKLDSDPASPAAYFAKAYYRFWWDYYRDENLFTEHPDFDTFWNDFRDELHRSTSILSAALKKDRLTSSLPWQLKAIAAPTIEITSSGSFTPNFNYENFIQAQHVDIGAYGYVNAGQSNDAPLLKAGTNGSADDLNEVLENNFNKTFNVNQSVNVTNLGFNAAEFRDMMAQTRVFERLARCGSRYTEYLRANFGVAPADDTLQRAQYLGGFKTRIVTTEVVQTAEAKSADGTKSYPVGTLRGHGITHGTATIKPFMAKEIGVMIAILDVKPETIYAQGVDRELTARSRFDFLNPSFQHLSEQEVRKGEIFFGTDTDEDGNLINSKTWGFQPYAQELRTGIKHVCGDMRDSLSYWNQSLIFSSRPELNNAFISAANHTASYNRPFAVSSADAYPLLIDFGGTIEAYRPLVKNGTPGLTDHN